SSGQTVVTATANGIGSVTFSGAVLNAIVAENQQPGTTAWQITNYVTSSNPEIVGYASAPSINKGASLPFKISLSSPGQYKVDVYRLRDHARTGRRPIGRVRPFPCTT